MTRSWTSPADIEARVRRAWDSGALLSSYASGQPFEPITVPLRGPTPAQIGDDLGAVQRWVAVLDSAALHGNNRRYLVERQPVGGRVVGRNLVPVRAIVSSYDEAWTLLGTHPEVRKYDEILRLTAGQPDVHAWVLAHPIQALRVTEDWLALLAAYDWLRTRGGHGLYLREISAPGVDTKFVERHRALLASLLGTSARAPGFASALGFQDRPAMVRLRFDHGFIGLPDQLTEATFRLDELARVRVSVQQAIIVENEITYLSVPVPREGVVLFGEGFRVSHAGALPWLRDAEVHYWGDLDTHGFAILHQLRGWLPQTRSLLMDRETLLAHRDRWGREPKPTSAELGRLDEAEQAVYTDLVSGHYADNIRLEQERIDWAYALGRWPLD